MRLPGPFPRLLLLSVTVLAAGCASAQTARDTPLQDFVRTVTQRNALAHDVAAFKFPQGRPIEDPVREAEVLAAKRAAALAQGLDADAVVDFYRQAIEANKLIQHVDVHRFVLGDTPPPAPPLDQLRHQIDAVDAQLLARWPAVESHRDGGACRGAVARSMAAEALPPLDHVALVRAMISFCREAGS